MEQLGSTAVNGQSGPRRERISFPPHPKTLTMAGDYEYFAAQGHHPLAFALAELVDNSLRATKSSNDRTIRLYLIIQDMSGVVAVSDVGTGMNRAELCEWAVMNLSVEDRGQKIPGRDENIEETGGRYLSGNLSYFGVGSKTAAFFMGSTVKLTSKQAASSCIRELSITASELERRYAAGEAVYEADLISRMPGDLSTLSEAEQSFPTVPQWTKAEAENEHASFTRVCISDLKPQVLSQLSSEEAVKALVRDLAHLYHYYIHGPQGNTTGAESRTHLPDGSLEPDIRVSYIVDGETCLEISLADVTDDLETSYVRAAASSLEFWLNVPGKGLVDCIMRYYPRIHDQDTVPCHARALVYPAGPVVASTQMPLTQLPLNLLATQRPGHKGTQRPYQSQKPGAGARLSIDEDDLDVSAARAPQAPIFEAFWQGRLIPGASVATLPVIEAIRSKHASAVGRDILPDEIFSRVRGALFFGPTFRVTRNKLTFRDSLPDLLSTALPVDRGLERTLREWLEACSKLDKVVTYEEMGDEAEQAVARRLFGESVTVFRSTSGSDLALSTGDVVRLAAKTSPLGQVRWLLVPQVVHQGGVYPCGRVVVAPLPVPVYGGAFVDLALRRVVGKADAEQVAEGVRKEMMKLPHSMSLEPMKLQRGRLEVVVGSPLPEVSVVVRNGMNTKITRAIMEGKKVALRVMATLRYQGPGIHTAQEAEYQANKEVQAHTSTAAARGRKRQRGKHTTQVSEAAPPKDDASAPSTCNICTTGEVVLETENRTPIGDTFIFTRNLTALGRAGKYSLLHEVLPRPRSEAGPEAPVYAHVLLNVIPGRPVRAEVGGEARAAAASALVSLGSPLPPLRITLFDHLNNLTAPALPSSTTCTQLTPTHSCLGGAPDANYLMESVSVSGLSLSSADVRLCMTAGPVCNGSAGSEITELEVKGGVVATDTGFTVSDLVIAPTSSAALALFGAAISPGCSPNRVPNSLGSENGGAQRTTPREMRPVAEVEAFLTVFIKGLTPQNFSVKLRPGAPAKLAHVNKPVQKSSTLTAAEPPLLSVMHGDVIPMLKVWVLDAWHHPTSPIRSGSHFVEVESNVIEDGTRQFQILPSGIVEISGLKSHCAAKHHIGSVQDLHVRLMTHGDHVPLASLLVHVNVLPSCLPSALRLKYQDQALTEVVDGEDGVSHELRGVSAGSTLSGLVLEMLDEGGRLAECSMKGKLQVSWEKGSKNLPSGFAGVLQLPPLPPDALERAGEEVFWVRINGSGAKWAAVSLETEFKVHVIPGPPHSWSMAIVHDGAANQPNVDNHGQIACGVPFCLEIDNLDKHNNTCIFESGTRLTPVITPISEAGGLVFDTGEWEQAWGPTQAGGQIYRVRLRLGGLAGSVKLVVKDAAGEDGGSLLLEDSIPVELVAGPPSALAFEGPLQLSCGTRGRLPDLRIHLCDEWGNMATTDKSLEVTLQPSALTADKSSHAAKVTVPGGNRVRLRNGVATFSGARLEAEVAGSYVLRVVSASRKVPLVDASLILQVCLENRVTSLVPTLVSETAPEPLSAGRTASVQVQVGTEDGKGLDYAVAQQSLVVWLLLEGSQARQCLELEESAVAGSSTTFHFTTIPLLKAGTYSIRAEYHEKREELLSTMNAKNEGQVVAPSLQLHVVAGAPANVLLEPSAVLNMEFVAVSNGKDAEKRRLLSSAAVQIVDEHDNPVAAAGQHVRWRLLSLTTENDDQAVMPQLEVSEGGAEAVTDTRGRVFFGDVGIVSGSGKMGVQRQASVLELQLHLEICLSQRQEQASWQSAWSCRVAFTDDESRAASIASLFAQRDELGNQLRQLKAAQESSDRLRQEAESKYSEAQRLSRHAAGRLQKLQGSQSTSAAVPNLSEAKASLRHVTEAAAREAAEPTNTKQQSLAARYGVSKSPQTAALKTILTRGDPDVIDVFANLATVNDAALSALLAAAFHPVLQTLVMRDSNGAQALRSKLQKANYTIPSILPVSMVSGYRIDRQSASIEMTGKSERVHRLEAEASTASDPLLPMLLPHTKLLLGSKRHIEGLSAESWPEGCLGYAVNLVRPTLPNTRANIIYSQFTTTLIFETLESAARYREYITQVLQGNMSTIFTLDGGKLSGSGVIAGSGFHVTRLEDAQVRFGAHQLTSQSKAQALEDERKHLEALVAALEDEEAARVAVEEAAADAQSAEHTWASSAPPLEEQLEKVEQDLKELGPEVGETAKVHGGGGRERKRGRLRDLATCREDTREQGAEASRELRNTKKGRGL